MLAKRTLLQTGCVAAVLAINVSDAQAQAQTSQAKPPAYYISEFEVTDAEGGSIIRQTAVFDPAGLAGLMYWYGIYPVHRRIFAGMLAGVAARAVNGWY